MEQTHPLFSVIILCWNSSQTLKACLDALESQTERDFEVLLVDNGSSLPIPPEICSAFPNLSIQFYQLEQNLGFAGGNNFAGTKANGEFLALLNADAFPQPDWLENIRKATLKYPQCFFASKLIRANQPDRLDGVGDVYHASGLAWRKAFRTPVSKVRDQEGEVFSACGAAAVYPSEAYHSAGGFDEAYYSYQEDVDLSFRLRLLGYKCIYIPSAVVYHVGSGSTSYRSDLSVYYGHRNLVWTFVKDMPGAWVWILAPLHLLVNLLMILVGITRGQGRVMLKAKLEGLRGIPEMWRKRLEVQSGRKVPVSRLLRAMDWNPVSPFTKLFTRT